VNTVLFYQILGVGQLPLVEVHVALGRRNVGVPQDRIRGNSGKDIGFGQCLLECLEAGTADLGPAKVDDPEIR
jgi:hypothetical protein